MKAATDTVVRVEDVPRRHAKHSSQSQVVDVIEIDNAALAALGYKQEFKRAFSPLEVCQPILFLRPYPYTHTGVWDRILYHRIAALYSVRSLCVST